MPLYYLFCMSLSSLLIFSMSTSVHRISKYPLMTVITLVYNPYSFCRSPSSFLTFIRPGYSVTERPNSCSPAEYIPYLLWSSSNWACNLELYFSYNRISYNSRHLTPSLSFSHYPNMLTTSHFPQFTKAISGKKIEVCDTFQTDRHYKKSYIRSNKTWLDKKKKADMQHKKFQKYAKIDFLCTVRPSKIN